jgi:pre-mRNA-splicing factor 38A
LWKVEHRSAITAAVVAMGDSDFRHGFKGQIHGLNPESLIEKIIRERIYESQYWKEFCVPLNAATLLDQAVQLKYIGGQYSNTRPTEFICLAFKLLQIQPEQEIIMEYLHAEEFKYLQALAMFYIRLTFSGVECYKVLEPFLNDYRKLRLRNQQGFELTYIDEYVDQLLRSDRVCDIALPRIPTRFALEETEELEPRESLLGSEIDSDAEGKTEGSDSDDD